MEKKKTAKAAAKESLQDLKKVREGKVSRLDQLQLEEEEDVYDMLDEEQYADLVEKRRTDGDFVVDDDGLGYFDNGEEVLGVGEDAFEAKKRLAENSNNDGKMAKKARRLAEESIPNRNSILKHLQSGVGPSKTISKEKAAQNPLDIDSLFANPSAARPATTAPMTRMPPIFRAPVMPMNIPRFSLMPKVDFNLDTEAAGHGSGGSMMDVDYGDNNYDNNYGGNYEPFGSTSSANANAMDTSEHAKGEGEKQEQEEVQQKISLMNAKGKKLGAFVTPAASIAAKERQQMERDAKPLSDLTIKTERVFDDNEAPTAVPMDLSKKLNPEQWLLRHVTNEETGEEEEYVRMYWLDAVEHNGLVYLFGRVPIIDEATKKMTNTVSCCVIVHGCERNLFVLPRINTNGGGERYDMSKVLSEVSKTLMPSLIPSQQDRKFKCKVVKRKYAFEYEEIPREETNYLKVVYSAKYATPNVKQCTSGEYYERIFGATSSAVELFVLKRKLLGPCWIEIKKPKMTNEAVSWCRLELSVQDPKWVVKVTESLPAPALVSMCLSIKTAVNPSTHLHEIVALSGVIHPKVDSEADSVVDPTLLRRFTFLRQLGLSCGNSYPPNLPHDIMLEVKKHRDIQLQTFPNERALLSMFLTRIQQEDPDIFASHNLLGFEFDVILSRCIANKLGNWSVLGKLRKSKPPKSVNDRDAIPGRILCDTYKAAKEFLRETTYSLTHLAQSQLKLGRQEIDPIDVPKYFGSSQDIGQVARHTFWDAWLVQGLMFKLQVVPLTKQLTNLSGNLWSRTIRGARAERIEYLLLHEFHALKFILPEKKLSEFATNNANKKRVVTAAIEEDGEDIEMVAGGNGKGVGGISRKRAKAAYAGGLVLEPKKGLYDSYILLLDFNSLYPSIIQEYNLCFTTINWTKFMPEALANAQAAHLANKSRKTANANEDGGGDEDSDSDNEDGADNTNDSAKALPPLPDSSAQAGVLPRVIKTLVDRRRQVKNLLKNEKDPAQRQQLDIRQKALKLTANSMYGCLGFSFSRFYARPIAALVTAMGREALQRTVDLATNQLQLDVIYGDTDSVMINTGLNQKGDFAQVREMGNKVKKEVNKLYRSLELDLDGIFRSMLLLKKKKYAALVVNEHHDGSVSYEKEMKGLDLVRRDWCVLSKETGKFVVDQILSGESCEEIVMKIHSHLHDLAVSVRSGTMDLDNFVITKGLNKNPKDYPDCNGQAHLQVALQMLKQNKPVNIGDHIPYVICMQGEAGATAAHRAYHPDEIRRAPTEYTVDYEWYLSNQILPPISRLCEPIEGTSAAIISERLGLDASKYAKAATREDGEDDDWGFTPKCLMDDTERFKDCLPLTCVCSACGETINVGSVTSLEPGMVALTCSNCNAMFFGKKNASDCYCYLSNRMTLMVRQCMKRYFDCWLVCDDHSCGRRTMQQSLRGLACTEDCHGRMMQEFDETHLHTQLKYLESLFDVPRMQVKKTIDDTAMMQMIPRGHHEVLRLLREHMANTVKGSAYNWVRPSLWTSLFGGKAGIGGAGAIMAASAGGAAMKGR